MCFSLLSLLNPLSYTRGCEPPLSNFAIFTSTPIVVLGYRNNTLSHVSKTHQFFFPKEVLVLFAPFHTSSYYFVPVLSML